jgi:CelD/BcsL family acetyltransferase involved in cellulose biosynthesis
MAIRLAATSDGALWQNLVEASPHRTAFHDWSWLWMVSDLFGWRFEPLLVLHDDEPVGVLPLFRERRPSPRSVSVPFPFLGPLVPDQHLVATLRELRRWQAQRGLVMVRFDFAPRAGSTVKEALTAARCDWVNDSTFVVDLSHGSHEVLRARTDREIRRRLRRAEENGVEVRPSLPGELANLLPRILDEAYSSHGKPSPYPAGCGEQIERWSAGRSDVYIGTALVHGTPAGVLVALGGAPVSIGWLGGCLRDFRRAAPNSILMVDSLDWALDQGHAAMDLAGYVNDEVAQFKAAFGAEQQPYISAASVRLPRFVIGAAQTMRRRRGRPPLAWSGGDAVRLH